MDGRATARHLHGEIARAAPCLTVKVPAESADAVSSIIVPPSLTTGALCQTRTIMVLMLVNLQEAAAIFRVARSAPSSWTVLCNYVKVGPRSGPHTCVALAETAPTDLTAAYASPLGAQPQSDLSLTASDLARYVRQVGARRSLHAPPRCPEARLPQIQSAGDRAGALGVCYHRVLRAVLKKHTPGTLQAAGAGACGRNL